MQNYSYSPTDPHYFSDLSLSGLVLYYMRGILYGEIDSKKGRGVPFYEHNDPAVLVAVHC